MKKLIIAVVVAVVVGGALGYAGGYFRGSSDVVASYAPKIVAVSKLFPAAPLTVNSLNGQVKNINGNIITIDAAPISQNPFTQGNFPVTREVTVTSATVIAQMKQTDPMVFQKEMQDFQQSIHPGSVSTGTAPAAIVTPPSPFTEITIPFSDIKVGDTITVTASSDISTAISFSATKIDEAVFSAPATIAPNASTTAK